MSRSRSSSSSGASQVSEKATAGGDFELPEETAGDYVDSFLTSEDAESEAGGSLGSTAEAETSPSNFLYLMSAISDAYVSGRYCKIIPLNDVPQEPLAEGQDYNVTTSELALETLPVLTQSLHRVRNRVVIKKARRSSQRTPLTEAEYKRFILELRILNHLHDVDTIVSLRGIGFFYEHCDEDLVPCPKPAFILEVAKGTVDQLLSAHPDMGLATEMTLCRDVTFALFSLHSAGISHGDIKPNNILVFADRRVQGGVETTYYRAKISDFSRARFLADSSRAHLAGAPSYKAPEGASVLLTEDVMLADVWSLGVLFGAITLRPARFLDTGEPTLVGETIRAETARLIEESSWDPEIQELRDIMVSASLQHDPSRRDLRQILHAFEDVQTIYMPPTTAPAADRQIQPPSCPELHISYEHLKYTSGSLKDLLVESLEIESLSRSDRRRGRALYELAVALLSRFARPDNNDQRGLRALHEAATLGDVVARGLFCRLQQTLASSRSQKDAQVDLGDAGWVVEAAEAGHSVAAEELAQMRLESPQVTQQPLGCLVRTSKTIPSHQRGFLSARDIDPCEGSSSSHTAADLHRAIAAGDLDGLTRLLDNSSTWLNVSNSSGDTPLMAATKAGQPLMVLILLQSGADPALCNFRDENMMHYAWCFRRPSDPVRDIFEFCQRRCEGVFLQTAKGAMSCSRVDFHHTPPGLPIERAISRNVAPIVELFLEFMPPIEPVNGLVFRRCLRLAFQYHNVDCQRAVINHIRDNTALYDETLSPLPRTTWLYRGQRRSFLDALAIGNVSGVGHGADLPVDFWRMCCHGQSSDEKLAGSISQFLSLLPDGQSGQPYIVLALELAFSEGAVGVAKALLVALAEITDGSFARLKSLRSLVWEQGDSQPEKIVNYVDQIFYSPEMGTLAQRAIYSGDRQMFHMLVHDFGAQLSLPCPFLAEHGYLQVSAPPINVYALFANATHYDLWFPEQFQKHHMQTLCPFASTDRAAIRSSPLLHALNVKFWGYALWLMRQDLSFGEYGPRALEAIAHPEDLDVEILSFLFPGDMASPAMTQIPPERVFYHVLTGIARPGQDAPTSETFYKKQALSWSHVLSNGAPFFFSLDSSHYIQVLGPRLIRKPPTSILWLCRESPDLTRRTVHHFEQVASQTNGRFPLPPRWSLLFWSPVDHLPLVESIRLLGRHGYFPSLRNQAIYSLALFLPPEIWATVRMVRLDMAFWLSRWFLRLLYLLFVVPACGITVVMAVVTAGDWEHIPFVLWWKAQVLFWELVAALVVSLPFVMVYVAIFLFLGVGWLSREATALMNPNVRDMYPDKPWPFGQKPATEWWFWPGVWPFNSLTFGMDKLPGELE
ncbi:hypothetical protein ACJ41O_001639 [Fusarium nematophilum]